MKLGLLGAIAAFTLAAGAAQAVPITAGSTINFAGQTTCTLSTCTFGDAIVTSSSGDFATGGIFGFNFLDAAVFQPLSVTPFVPGLVYTAYNQPLQGISNETSTFTSTSQTQHDTAIVNGLTQTTVTDLGIVTLSGALINRDPTQGVFTFTANQNGTIQGSFSATTTASAVPEPMSLAILGAGLAGLGWIKRRKAA